MTALEDALGTLPRQLQDLASKVSSNFLEKNGFKVHVSSAIDVDAPYRTSLLGKRGKNYHVLVDLQESVTIPDELKKLRNHLLGQRAYAEIIVATYDAATLSGSMLASFEKLGIGLLFVDEKGRCKVHLPAQNWALQVQRHPDLALGKHRQTVDGLIQDFNAGKRKKALEDVCDIAEKETDVLVGLAARNGLMTFTPEQVRQMDWSGQINVLASAQRFHDQKPVLDGTQKTEMHHVRDQRNHTDHPARSRWEARRLEHQEVKRMHDAIQAISDLTRLQRITARRRPPAAQQGQTTP